MSAIRPLNEPRKPKVHQEFLWTLGKREKDGTTSIMYLFQTRQHDCYRAVVESEFYDTGWTGKRLALDGWKPVRVLVTGDFP